VRSQIAESFDLEALKALIIDSLHLEGVTPAMIGDDQPLFGDGLGLDSVDALELVIALEKRLGVKIRTQGVSPEAFSSAASLLRFVKDQAAVQRD
jgi:acyl carrier protein